MSRLLYNRCSVLKRLFWFFQNYFRTAAIPTMENLFLLAVSMLALDTFHSVRYAWMHIISKFTKKSLNSFYYTLEHAAFDHQKWASVTARLALCTVLSSLKDSAVFLSIDDTMVEKYGVKFRACSHFGLYSIRWNIEIGYYEMKSFWSLRDYMVRSVKGIERLINLTCISYAACKLLPHYSMDFADYKGLSPQEVRYRLGEKIRMGIIMCSLEQTIETLENNLPLKKAFQEFKRKWG